MVELHIKSYTTIKQDNVNKFNKSIIKGLNNFCLNNKDGKDKNIDRINQIRTLTFHDLESTTGNCMEFMRALQEKDDLNIETIGVFNCTPAVPSAKIFSDVMINIRNLNSVVFDHVMWPNPKSLAAVSSDAGVSKVYGLVCTGAISLNSTDLFTRSLSSPSWSHSGLTLSPTSLTRKDFKKFTDSTVERSGLTGANSASLNENLCKLFEISPGLASSRFCTMTSWLQKKLPIPQEQLSQQLDSGDHLIENVKQTKINLEAIAKYITINNYLRGSLKSFKFSLDFPTRKNFFNGTFNSLKDVLMVVDKLRDTKKAEELKEASDFEKRNFCNMENVTLTTYNEWKGLSGSNHNMMWEDKAKMTNPKLFLKNSFMNFVRDNKKLKTLNLSLGCTDLH
eukprot:CAMPEP_0116898448 /NCGR_PEP_ID=MMETSP0467-20121206/7169_1 /TAXON_ID=283647 /ORGANISM="Mesodinium pulex, Strain SPMC105" /LENGTH=393 /DNA_ID=CAMNT_0004570583 /DNA_START=342 /DNA_END=1527 /DNA_ORIENTATION=+